MVDHSRSSVQPNEVYDLMFTISKTSSHMVLSTLVTSLLCMQAKWVLAEIKTPLCILLYDDINYIVNDNDKHKRATYEMAETCNSVRRRRLSLQT